MSYHKRAIELRDKKGYYNFPKSIWLHIGPFNDAIYLFRQLMKSYPVVNKNLHMVFINLKKAYDNAPSEVLG